MKILVAHASYQLTGGEDHCVAAEIAMLEAHGHDVVQYRLHNDSVTGMNPLALGLRSIWSGPAYRDLRALMRTHRPDVAHFHNTLPLISPAAYYAARAEDVAVVQTLHNFRVTCVNGLLFREDQVCEECLGLPIAWPGVARGCYRNSRPASAAVATMAAAHRLLGTWQRKVDTYIALSEFSRRKFVQAGLPAEKIVVKPNFVYPAPPAGDGRGGYAIYVGRLSGEKGLPTLIAAWRELGGAPPLKIVGDGPLAPIVDSAARAGIVEWLHSLPLQSVYDLIGDAACLIVPSQCYENFPRVVIEAYAKGTPVIVSRRGAMAEIVQHGKSGLHFEPGNAADLAAKVRQLLGNGVDLRGMRNFVRTEFETRFTAEANHAELMRIYRRLTAAGSIARRRRAGLSAGYP